VAGDRGVPSPLAPPGMIRIAGPAQTAQRGVTMTQDFEYDSYNDADRIAILENRAADLERRLLAFVPPDPATGWRNVAMPANGPQPDPGPAADEPDFDDLAGQPADHHADPESGARTEALITHGRPRARRSRTRRVLAHWRLLLVAVVALTGGAIAALIALGGSDAAWPSSVTTVRAEIKQACANPDVAAEPSGLNFACDKETQQVLWVFSLLTSGNNPGYVDQGTGRKGLEPIQPAQGGDIAWSLNLHHPYSAASPLDSLEVAARAINNIIGGATLTSSSGGALVEGGLESTAANCQRYTGSARLVTRRGYPARCASPVTPGDGEAALVSDAFQQWMGGTPSQIAAEAGILFENAGNPGNPKVQAILGSLPASGQ
jgi:hypothetical protein